MLRPGVDAFAFRELSHQALPAGSVRPGGSRLLAARLLERNLLRLGRAGTLLERRLAIRLRRLCSLHLYRPLGFVRLGDYLTERLGMSLRRCQTILRLERIVESLPGLGQALRAGEVSFSKVEIVAGVATAATEALWLERTRRLTVAELREAVRSSQIGGEQAAGYAAHDGPTIASTGPIVSPAIVPPAVEAIEQDEPACLVSFAAPAPVFAVWHWTLDLVRRVAGRQEPAWRCAEYLAAEFLSGVPAANAPPSSVANMPPSPMANDPLSPTASPEKDAQVITAEIAAEAVAPAADLSEMASWIEACEAVREALASIGAAADVASLESALEPVDGNDEPDPWELDALLRRLVRLRQSLAWRQGRLLATFAALRLHRELGFRSLDDWIVERLPMSIRRARYLISLERRLRVLPLVADAYRRGLVSWCQARLLVRITAPATQARWIRYARRVTVRRLEEAVVTCEVEAGAPAHIGASPLPPADRLPGDAPPGDDPPGVGPPGDAPPRDAAADSDLHTSALLVGRDGQDETTRALRLGRRTWRRIAFWAPVDVASLWDSALRACRAAAGLQLDDWECFLHFVRTLRDTWDNPDDAQWKRRYRVFERDGWRCKAPGCTSRSGLNEHHIVFRSQQGDDDAANLVTLCVGHHQQGVHAGRLRCFGRAPDFVWWDLGTRPGGEPLVRYFGDRIVSRRPRMLLPARVATGAAFTRVAATGAAVPARVATGSA